jgi:hypothetical protein
MPQTLAANDSRLTPHLMGAISTESTDDGVMAWRINYEEKVLYANELVMRAAMPAGVRVTFQSNTSMIEGTCDSVEERNRIDLVVDDKLAGSVDTESQTSFRFENLGSEAKNFELWLPQFGEFRLGGLTIDDGAEISSAPTSTTPKWTTYGSSITHCSTADSPTQT